MKKLLTISFVFLSLLGFSQVVVVNEGTKIKISNPRDSVFIKGYYIDKNTSTTNNKIKNSGLMLIQGHMLKSTTQVFDNSASAGIPNRDGRLYIKSLGTPFSILSAYAGSVPSALNSTTPQQPIWHPGFNSASVTIDIGSSGVLWSPYASGLDAELIDSLTLVSGNLHKRGKLKLYGNSWTGDPYRGRIINESETNRIFGPNLWDNTKTGEIELKWESGNRSGSDNSGIGINSMDNLSGAHVYLHRYLAGSPDSSNIVRSIRRSYGLNFATGPTSSNQFQFNYLNAENDSNALTDAQLFKTSTGAYSNSVGQWRGFQSSTSVQNKQFTSTKVDPGSGYKMIALGDCPVVPTINIAQTSITQCIDTVADDKVIIDARGGAGKEAGITYQWYKNEVPIVDSTREQIVLDFTGGTGAPGGSGYFSVVATDPSNGCFSTDTVQVTLNPKPHPDFILPAVTNPRCYGTKHTFVNNSSIPTGWSISTTKWDFDSRVGGTPWVDSTGTANGEYTYHDTTAPLQITVRMYAISAAACTSQVNFKYIDIYKKPRVKISPNPTAAICEDAPLVLQNASSAFDGGNPLSQSTWIHGDGTSNTVYSGGQVTSNSSHAYTNTTNSNVSRTVKLIVSTAKGCIDSTSIGVTVYPKPVANVAVNLHAGARLYEVCQDTGIGFSYSNSFNVQSVMWDFGNAATNTHNSAKRANNSPTGVHYQASGSFTPKLVITSPQSCKDSFNTSQVVIHPLPISRFRALDSVICQNQFLDLKDSSNTRGAGTSYSWEYGNGSTPGTTTNQLHKYHYPLSGSYKVKLRLNTAKRCKDTSEIHVRIKPMPLISFTLANKCEDSTVAFNSTTIASPNGSLPTPTYDWDFGLTSTNANYTAERTKEDPNVEYAQHGSYNPKVVVTSEGCKDTMTHNLVIHPNPVADFTNTDNCGGDAATFTNTSTLANSRPYTYIWNMGDGTTYNNQSPISHSYANSQIYNMSLTVTSDSGCIDKKELAFRVFDIPIAKWDSVPATVCNLIPSQFRSQNSMKRGSAVTHLWDFGTGDTSWAKDTNHVYTNPNTYNVSLHAIPADSTNPCRDTATHIVVIHPNPQTNYTFNDNCLDDTITFTNTTTIAYTNMVNHFWDFGDKKSNSLDTTTTVSVVKHMFDKTIDSTYVVSLKVLSDKGCLIEKKDSVRSYARPNARWDTSKATVCIYDTSEFINQSFMNNGAKMTYLWDFFYNNQTDTAANPKFYYPPTKANYNVKLNVRPADTTNVCRDSSIIKIHLWDLPDSGFATTLDTFCFGRITHFIKSKPQGKHTYHWYFGDNTVDSTNSTYVGKEYQNPGPYSVTLKAESRYGCKSDSTVNLYVIPLPRADFTLAPDTVCLGDTIAFTNTSDTIANYYVWNFGDASTPDTNALNTYHPKRAYATANSFSVELAAVRGFQGGRFTCISREAKWARVEPLPVTQFTASRNAKAGRTFAFANTSFLPNGINGSLSYKWNYGNSDSSTNAAAYYNYTYSNLGQYVVKLRATSAFGCFTEKTDTIDAVTTPTSKFGISDSAVCGAKTINFSNQSTNAQSYKWYFGDNTTSTDSVPNHTYSRPGRYIVQLVASDTNGYKDTSQTLLVVNAIPNARPSALGACAGTNILFANNSIIQSQENLSYKWLFGNGDTSTIAAPSYAFPSGGNKTVSLIATSDSGCVDTTDLNLSIDALPSVNFDSNAARVCLGDTSKLVGNISISAGSIGSRFWRIQGDPSTYSSTNVNKVFGSAGIYNVTLGAVSSNGCRDSITKKVHVDLLPNIPLADTQRTCGATLNLNAQNSGSSYAWSTSDTSQSITATTDGLYSVTVTLGSGCTASKSTQIFLNTTVLPNLGNDFAVCGDTILDAKNPGASYVWSNSATSRTINVTASDTFSVVVTDQNNCIGRDTVIVTRKNPPAVNLGADTTECAGTPVTLNAGSNGDTYAWVNSTVTTPTLTVSSPGTYVAAVTDTSTQCTTRDTIEVKFRYSPPVNLGSDRTVCGSQTVLLNAGTFANVNYLWNTNATSQTLTATTSGKYWAKVTDQIKGCSRTDTIDVQINALPVVNLGNARTVCAGSASTLTQANVSGFKYQWSTNDTSNSITATATGVYSLTVTDTNNCSGFGNVSLTVLSVPQVNLGADDTICAGTSKLLQATSNGSNAIWSTNVNQAILSVNSGGTYWATATNGSCVSSDTIVITAAPNPQVNLGSVNSVCGSGNLVLDAGSYGGSFKWNDASTSQTRTVNNTGLYSVQVIDSNGCKGNASINVTVHSSPTRQLSNSSVCAGVPVFLNAKNPGSNYSWSNSSTQQGISVTQAGTYRVTITNSGGCSIIDSAVVQVAAQPTVNLGSDTTVCAGNNVILDAGNPGSTYRWSNNATSRTINVANSGFYAVTVTNTNGCTNNDSKTVAVHGFPNVNLGPDKLGCTGDTFNLQSLVNYPSGYNYLWSMGGSGTASNFRAGSTQSYVLAVTNNFSCTRTDTIDVTIASPPTVNLGPDNTVCKDTLLNAQNSGASFLWNNNSTNQQITATQTGTYVVAVSVGQCTSRDTINLTVHPLPVVNLGPDLTTCATVPPTINAGNLGSSYLWSTSATSRTIVPSTSGSYGVRVTNPQGCSSNDTVVITLTNGPQDSLGADINICWDGNPITLDAKNTGSTYRWSTGKRSQTVSISNSGAYAVTVTDPSNCADTAYINVTLRPTPQIDLGVDRSVCDSTLLDAKNNGSSYLWSTTSTDRLQMIRNSGQYWVAITNAQSCVGTDTVNITISDGPLVNLGSDTVVCSGRALTYKVNQPGVSILWSNNSTIDSLNIQAPGDYWLKLTDSSNCSNADTINVSLGRLPNIDLGKDTTLCSNQDYPLEIDSGYASYNWIGPNSFRDTLRSIAAKESGRYWVTVTSNDGCVNNDSIKLTLTNDTVRARFLMPSKAAIGDSVTMADLSTDNVKTWSWNFGDNTTSGNQDPLKIYILEGKYTVSLQVSNGVCLDRTSKTIEITKELKKKPIEEEELVPNDVIRILSAKVFPNPNRGEFTFRVNLSEEEDFMIYFFDMRGVIIHKERQNKLNTYEKKYHFGGLAQGIYFLKVITASEQTETFKIVINE